MFEKISGFFKQFTRRRKRQSGETTIMESKEPGADEFGLDGDFADLDTFGDTDGVGGTGDFVETADLADTGGIGDFEDAGGGLSDEFDAGPRVEDEFSDFDIATEDSEISEGAEISTGGSDLEGRTISDEITGATAAEFGEARGEFGDAFAVGEEGPAFEGAEAKARSPLKGILITILAFIVAIGVGAAFQLYAWPSVSKLIGLGGSGELKVDPQIQLTKAQKDETRLTNELAEFKKVGTPAEVKALKAQIAETRKTQGSMEDLKTELEEVKKKETEYDGLIKQIETLEANINEMGNEIDDVRGEIRQAKQRVIKLAKQTEEEYERFNFELTRAELGQRLFIELQIRDLESFRKDVAELERRLAKLSSVTLVSTTADAASPEKASTAETSGN
jgi:hypothetical protein